jgi:hypothetical protein
MSAPRDYDPLSDAAKAKRKRANLAIALALFGFVVLVFIVTIARLGGHVFDRVQ